MKTSPLSFNTPSDMFSSCGENLRSITFPLNSGSVAICFQVPVSLISFQSDTVLSKLEDAKRFPKQGFAQETLLE